VDSLELGLKPVSSRKPTDTSENFCWRVYWFTIYNYIYSAAVLAGRSLGVGPAGPLTSQNVNPVTFKRSSQEMSANSYTCQSGMAEA